jgi:DNA-binding NtrC family response regulator
VSGAATKSPVRPTRVLVVDDDAGIRNFLRMLLELEGYVVATVSNGNEALEVQRQDPAAVVVTDIFMPEGEGMETIVQLRAEFPLVRIIVMSGAGAYRGADYLQLARELGAAKALKKPFAPQELIDAMREVAGTQPAA